jgi:hypothetical protein
MKDEKVGTGLAFWASWLCQLDPQLCLGLLQFSALLHRAFLRFLIFIFSYKDPKKGWRPTKKRPFRTRGGVEVYVSRPWISEMEWSWIGSEKGKWFLWGTLCTSMYYIDLYCWYLCRTMSMILHSYIFFRQVRSVVFCLAWSSSMFRLMDQHVRKASMDFLVRTRSWKSKSVIWRRSSAAMSKARITGVPPRWNHGSLRSADEPNHWDFDVWWYHVISPDVSILAPYNTIRYI